MDKNTEYSALKNELINLDTERNNLVIAMYSIFITVFCFSVEFKNKFALLSLYIVLFAFQRRFITIRDGMNRIAAYITVYLDNPYGWESNLITIFKETSLKNKQDVKMPKVIELVTGRVASVQLGLFSSLGTIIMIIIAYIERIQQSLASSGQYMLMYNISLTDVILIIIAIVFYTSLYKWASYPSKDQRATYIHSLAEYKAKTESQQSSN